MGREWVSSEGKDDEKFQEGGIHVRSEVPVLGGHSTYSGGQEGQGGRHMVVAGEPVAYDAAEMQKS